MSISKALANEFDIVSKFPLTYRNREDITNLPPGVLVVGSKNIRSNVSERLGSRKGYIMDGAWWTYIQDTVIASNYVTLGSTHGFTTGGKIQVYFTSGITGLTSGNTYYAIVVTSTRLSFATSVANANAGTAITISGTPLGGYITQQKSATVAPISSSFDWNSKGNAEIHQRVGFLTSTSNGKMQFRWTNSAGDAYWSDLLTGLTTDKYNFTTFWNTTELVRETLFVNGSSNIYKWNGAFDTVVSTTSNTITVSSNIATTGFYSSSNRTVTVRGIDYTYSGISGSTFTGVSPDPTTGANTVYAGDILVQKVVTTANSSMTGIPSTFTNGLISTLNNQVFVGSLTSATGYMSKQNSFTDFSNSTPRIPGDGATFTLDDNLVAFIPQENVMYISCGKNFWYNTSLQQNTSYNGTTALITESFIVQLLKTNATQGAQSQALVGKIKNDVAAVTFEPNLDFIGRVDQIFGTPQTSNISDSIKLDFDKYDFTGGSVFYHRYNVYVTVPTEGIVRIYSLLTKSWETPQTLPITRFYVVDGQLYGHSSLTSESYKMDTGYSDRATETESGNTYECIAAFSYQNAGTRTRLKNANEFYIEGYITANTTLNGYINYDLDGNQTQQTFTINGNDSFIVGSQDTSNSLGLNRFGLVGLGSQVDTSLTGLPPKFRVIKTFTRFDYYECQFGFVISGVNQNFELLAFGINSQISDTTNAQITD